MILPPWTLLHVPQNLLFFPLHSTPVWGLGFFISMFSYKMFLHGMLDCFCGPKKYHQGRMIYLLSRNLWAIFCTDQQISTWQWDLQQKVTLFFYIENNDIFFLGGISLQFDVKFLILEQFSDMHDTFLERYKISEVKLVY